MVEKEAGRIPAGTTITGRAEKWYKNKKEELNAHFIRHSRLLHVVHIHSARSCSGQSASCSSTCDDLLRGDAERKRSSRQLDCRYLQKSDQMARLKHR